MFDHLLQFYWPHGQKQSRKKDPRRGIRRIFSKPMVLALTLACLLVGVSASALADARRLSDQRNLVFSRIGAQEGLSDAGVTTIVQDEVGFIWAGTPAGLFRFDGYTFQEFSREEGIDGTLSHSSVWDLLPDDDGGMWIATEDGLNRYDPVTEKFHHFSLDTEGLGDEHERILSLYRDSDGTLWVGTGVGLSRYEGNGRFTHFHHDPTDPSSIGRGGVRAMLEDSAGRFWVGTEVKGLHLLDRQKGTFSRLDVVGDNFVRDLLEDRGKIWVSTFRGITIFDPVNGDTRDFKQGPGPADLASNRVRALLKDDDGNIWVGSDGGLHLWDRRRKTFSRFVYDPSEPRSISDNTIFDLFLDRGGVMWVGTYKGISKANIETDTFPHFHRSPNEDSGLSDNTVTSFAEQGADIWIGTFNGLNKWDGEEERFQMVLGRDDALGDDMVMSLGIYEEALWAGTARGGVSVIGEDRVVTTFRSDPADVTTLSGNAVADIFVDSKNRLWLAIMGGGVNRYLGNGRFKRYPDPAVDGGRFSDLRAVALEEADDGKLWIATDGGGVVVLDPETGKTEVFRHDPENPASLPSDNAIELRNAGGSMWVGTYDRGLSRYHPTTRQFTHYRKTDGLASDAVFGILEDDDGRLWISGQGLTLLDPDSGETVTYHAIHGIQSYDFNNGAHLKLSDGSFLFGGNNGFNAFDPADLEVRNENVPPIVITEYSEFNEPVALDIPIHRAGGTDALELSYDSYVIGFEFSAMDFTAPEQNRYQYKLDGFDRDWVDARPGTRQVTYTNLDPGDYRFQVRGSNNDGVWNLGGASVALVVTPPLWATWWAYLGYLGLGVVALYQAQKANERRLRRDAEKRYSERLQLYIESLEEATDCVLIADANKNLMYANNAIGSILGMTPSQAVGRSIFSLLFTDVNDANLARHGLEREGRWHGEVGGTRDGNLVTTEVTIASVKDDAQNETAFVAIARDVSERKRTQAELDNHRKNLEFLVAERTKALEHEIAENKAFQRELANSLREKELLLKEVHHRVKNNMQVISSLLNIQAETIDNAEFASLLGESQQRIKSMSLIHENLYQSDDLLEIDFEDYIRMLANSLCRFYTIPGVSVHLDVQVEDVKLDIETAVPCGLIINELISNSLKHAFGGREGSATIRVRFRNVGCQYVLSISDDGVGLPENFDPSASSSMGMEIVSILTQQLDGRLRISGTEGASFEIAFPRKEKADVA